MGSSSSCYSTRKSRNNLSLNSDPSYSRKQSESFNTSVLLDKLKDKTLNFQIEISPDDQYQNRKNSAEWFFEKLESETIHSNTSYKVMHRNRDNFCVYLVNGYNKKIIFSSSESHIDAVTGSIINRKNYYMILNNIVDFVEKGH
jgi:hypothetical protein